LKAPLALVCLLLVLGLSSDARGWNASGHMQIAMLAYDALPGATRRELGDLLLEHPRFHEDFAASIPAELDAEARRRWIFAFASTWPDVARGQPAYEHPTWHYVNLRLHLRREGLASCREARSAHLASERAAEKPSESIVTAFSWALGTLMDRARPASERALALSWLLHLVGDAHQPLHGVALFTPARFVGGDRGGNEIILRGRGSLHRVWDGLLGEAASLSALDASVRALAADRALARSAALAIRTLSIDDWIDEDCVLARSFVYVPAILAAVRRFEREGREGKPEVSLRGAYFEVAIGAARARAVQAAARLQALLSPDTSQGQSLQGSSLQGKSPAGHGE
jgi:hypothetical protein